MDDEGMTTKPTMGDDGAGMDSGYSTQTTDSSRSSSTTTSSGASTPRQSYSSAGREHEQSVDLDRVLEGLALVTDSQAQSRDNRDSTTTTTSGLVSAMDTSTSTSALTPRSRSRSSTPVPASPDDGFVEEGDASTRTWLSGNDGGNAKRLTTTRMYGTTADVTTGTRHGVEGRAGTTIGRTVGGFPNNSSSSSSSYPRNDGGSRGSISSESTTTSTKTDHRVERIQVLVKTLRGNTVTCDLNTKSLVRDLATEAFHKSGVPADQQRLVFQGSNLNCETDPLVKFGIKNLSTVHMMGRLRGGGTTTTITLTCKAL